MDNSRSISLSPAILPFILLTLSNRALSSPVPQSNPADGTTSDYDLNPDSNSNFDSEQSHSYYLIVLVIIAIALLAIFAIFMTRRRKKAAIAARARLVRDMEAARGQRFVAANTRGHANHSWGVQMVNWGVGRDPTTGAVRGHEGLEGLDERGEAPPPYEPKRKEVGEDNNATESARDSEDTNEHGNKAPNYEEVVLTRPSPTHRGSTRRGEDGDEGMGLPTAHDNSPASPR